MESGIKKSDSTNEPNEKAYPGVDLPNEHDVMLQRQVDDELRRDIVKLDRDRLEHDETNSLRQMRAVAVQTAQTLAGAENLTRLLSNATAIQDFMLNGTVPEGHPTTPDA